MATQDTLSLEELIGAPLRGVSRAQQRLAEASLTSLRAYMHEGPDGQLRARMVSFELRGSGPRATRRQLEVPLLSLVTVPSLIIDEAEVEMVSELRRTESLSASEAQQFRQLSGGGQPAPRLRCRLSSPQALWRCRRCRS